MRADDTLLNVYCCATDLAVEQKQFQWDIDRVQDWMENNRFQLRKLISFC